MSVCFFNSLPNGENSNLLIVVAFSNSSSPGKISSPVKNSNLPAFPECKAKTLAVCLYYIEVLNSVSLDFVIDRLNFLTNNHFIIRFF